MVKTYGYHTYGVVLAHREGAAVERILTGTACESMAAAQAHADVWTRRHGHGPLDTDRCGHYAYADRISRPAIRILVK
jgi:hypothetical protein